MILHTRWATQGSESFPENNHPIVTGPIALVHNGVIWNDDSLFKTISAWTRVGQVDSEVLPALVLDRGWDRALDAIAEVEGSYAVSILNADRPGELIVARGNESPVLYYTNGKVLVWASEERAILDAWKAVFNTRPSTNHIRMMAEGTALCVADGEVVQTSFETKAYYNERAWVKYYTSTDGHPALCALPALPETIGPQVSWDQTRWHTCEMCDGYFSTDLYDVYGMAVCTDCAMQLTGEQDPEYLDEAVEDCNDDYYRPEPRTDRKPDPGTHAVPLAQDEAIARFVAEHADRLSDIDRS